jgi:hypothetical protein
MHVARRCAAVPGQRQAQKPTTEGHRINQMECDAPTFTHHAFRKSIPIFGPKR